MNVRRLFALLMASAYLLAPLAAYGGTYINHCRHKTDKVESHKHHLQVAQIPATKSHGSHHADHKKKCNHKEGNCSCKKLTCANAGKCSIKNIALSFAPKREMVRKISEAPVSSFTDNARDENLWFISGDGSKALAGYYLLPYRPPSA